MKVPSTIKDGLKLHVAIKGYFYAITLYKDFKSIKELREYVKDNFGTNKFEYYYSRGC